MSRKRRDFIPGLPYHLTQRGNRKLPTFVDDRDRRIYLDLLVEHSTAQEVQIWAYSLMPNHVHHIAVPQDEHGLSRAFQQVHGEYSRYFNARHEKVGHLGMRGFTRVSSMKPTSGMLCGMSSGIP
jgi:putative transposase